MKGSSIVLKQGSKVNSIRLVSGGDHEVDCKLDQGNFMLKASPAVWVKSALASVGQLGM